MDPICGRYRLTIRAMPALCSSAVSIQYSGRVSRDGKWLAYTSNENGPPQVYVTEYPTGRIRQVSENSGGSPVWSRTGDELFFLENERLVSKRISERGDIGPAAPVAVGPIARSGGPGIGKLRRFFERQLRDRHRGPAACCSTHAESHSQLDCAVDEK